MYHIFAKYFGLSLGLGPDCLWPRSQNVRLDF